MQTSITIKEQFILQVSRVLITSEEIQEITLEGQMITMQEERIFISLPRQMVKIKVQIEVKIQVQIPWSEQAFPAFRQSLPFQETVISTP